MWMPIHGDFPSLLTQSFFATGEALRPSQVSSIEKGEVERKMEGQLAIYSLHEKPLISKHQWRKAYSRRERRHSAI